MNTNPPTSILQRLRCASSLARALPAVLALAALAVPSRSVALTLPPPVNLGAASVKSVAPGYVVGTTNSRAFVWSAATQTMQVIPTPADSALSMATGVNSHGEVVGGYWASDYSSSTAFYWSQATGVVTICPGANFSQSPVFINENGVVAGTDNQGHVFRWTRTGGRQDLGGTGGPYSSWVTGINARGDIVGEAGGAFVAWASGNSLTILQSPGTSGPPNNVGYTENMGGNGVEIKGINDSGVVVGTYWDFEYIYYGYDISQGGFFSADVHNSHAFKWTAAGGFTDLGNLGTWTLPGNPNPIFAARATAINNDGTIVGYSYLSAGNNYVPFAYKPGSGMTPLPKLNSYDDYAMATGINDDGVIAGWSHQNQYSVLWTNGVPTNITPSFAGLWTGSPLIKGSTVAGNGASAWTFALPSAPVLPTQTLTILGGSGTPGTIAPNVEYYNPATGNWQPAYLTGSHPWGFINGTNSWINYKTNTSSDPGAGLNGTNSTYWYLYRVRFTVPADAVNPQMTFSANADNFTQVAINGVTTGGSTQFINNANMPNVIVGGPGVVVQFNAGSAFSQNVHPGENTITLNVGDWGGLNGFNFRIDLSMQSSQPPVIVTPPSDTTPPVITSPGNIIREATSAAGAVVNFTATAVDAVSGPVAVVASPASGSTFPISSPGPVTVVGLAASDAAGNTATASFTVTVRDTTAPVVSVPGNITAEATSASGAVVSYAAPTATDAVGVTSLTSAPASGSTFPLGTTTVTATAKDAANNTGTGTFTITVKDTIAPTLTVPASQTLEATGAAGAAATFSASATDAVGVTSLTYSAASGSTFALGTTTVTVTAKDAAGNTSTGSFTITVKDTTAPTITSLSTNAPTLWPPNHKMVAVTVSAAATDLVGVASLKIISVTSSEPDNGLGDGDTAGDIQITGALTLNLRAERSGSGNGRIYTITVQAKDAAGNASTKTCTVSVPKSQGGK